jgi:heat shock protein 1/8
MSASKNAIGIDLGTTYSCVAVMRKDTGSGNVEIIANDLGMRTTPSYVAFSGEERLVGLSAKNQAAMNPENTVFDAKRLIGRNFTDATVQSDMKHFPFKVKGDSKNLPIIEVDYQSDRKSFKPEQISAMVLSKLKADAEAYLGEPVTDAVITVPAYFNDSQRQSTKDAGVIAGLNVLRIITEPVSAALSYGFDLSQDGGVRKLDEDHNILVFDLGGGTFDVSLITLCDGVYEVKATSGDTHLGGEDFDNRMVDYCASIFNKEHSNLVGQDDIKSNPRALRRLRTACERAKLTLSASTQAIIDIDSLHAGHDFNHTISRAKFEDLCIDLFRGCLKPVETVLTDAKMGKSEIHEVVLVGGSTRIPKVQQLLSDFFQGKKLNNSINPDEAVAYGAAVMAFILNGGKSKKTDDVLVCDVTPLSLGVNTMGDITARVVPRGSKIPCNKKQIFTTASPNQTEVTINVFQGERKFSKDNHALGKFSAQVAPSQTQPEIEISFDIDSNGIVKVSAVDKATGKSSEITITSGQRNLSTAEIDRMVKEAEQYKEKDEENAERVQTQQQFERALDQCPQDDPKVADMREWLQTNPSTAELKAKIAEIMAMSKQEQPHPQAEPNNETIFGNQFKKSEPKIEEVD